MEFTERECPACGRKFSAIGKKRYCCVSCKRAAARAKKREKDKKRMETRTCLICGKEFTTTPQIKALYCSLECRAQARKERKAKRTAARQEERHCPVCGTSFSSASRPNKTYCSEKCKRYANRKTWIEKKASLPVQAETIQAITCKWCGKEFYAKAHSARKYCSKSCASSAQAERDRQRRHAPKPFHETTCPQCGKDFIPEHHAQRFCCRDCACKFYDQARRREVAAIQYGIPMEDPWQSGRLPQSVTKNQFEADYGGINRVERRTWPCFNLYAPSILLHVVDEEMPAEEKEMEMEENALC